MDGGSAVPTGPHWALLLPFSIVIPGHQSTWIIPAGKPRMVTDYPTFATLNKSTAKQMRPDKRLDGTFNAIRKLSSSLVVAVANDWQPTRSYGAAAASVPCVKTLTTNAWHLVTRISERSAFRAPRIIIIARNILDLRSFSDRSGC